MPIMNPISIENALNYGKVIPPTTKKEDSTNTTILLFFLALIAYVVFK